MISFFRRALSSWVVLGLLGLIMVAFIITGVESPSILGGGGGGATVAKVDGKKISALELTNRVRNQIDGLRRERPEIDAPSFLASGGFEQVLNGMINARALEAWGKEQGFAISKRMVDAEIAGMQGFRNVAGQFDESVMRTVLAQARISEKELRADIAAKPDARLLVHRNGGRIDGCVWIEPAGERVWYLGLLTVRPDLQANGLGRALLEGAEAAALALGGGRIRMTVVHIRDTLIAWYERRGYARTGEVLPFPYGDPPRDDLTFVVLEKELQPIGQR